MSGGSLQEKGLSGVRTCRFRSNNATAVYRRYWTDAASHWCHIFWPWKTYGRGACKRSCPSFRHEVFRFRGVPIARNLPLRTRAVIEFLTEVVRADPAMSNLGIIANEALEPEVPGAGESLSAS